MREIFYHQQIIYLKLSKKYRCTNVVNNVIIYFYFVIELELVILCRVKAIILTTHAKL